MPLLNLPLPTASGALPSDVARFLREADRRIDEFQRDTRVFGFVKSDYAGAYHVLRGIAESSLARGQQFCEWGSGFGVVTALAAMIGFEACGIETEPRLVDSARRLAEDFGQVVDFTCGSFIPRGAEAHVDGAGEYAWLTTQSDEAYADLGLEIADFDVIFAYPWPDEEIIVGELFERYAGAGALLVTYDGVNGFCIRRRIMKRSRGKK